MEKLIQKFEEVFILNTKEPKPYTEDFTSIESLEKDNKYMLTRLSTYNAELSKKIAIDFAKYDERYIGQRILGKVEEIKLEDLFNKFLETYEL
jgi:hypothetical protein